MGAAAGAAGHAGGLYRTARLVVRIAIVACNSVDAFGVLCAARRAIGAVDHRFER